MSVSDTDALVTLRAKKRKIDDEINVVAQKFPQVGDLVCISTEEDKRTYVVRKISGDVGDCECKYELRFPTKYHEFVIAKSPGITISSRNAQYQELRARSDVLTKEVNTKQLENKALNMEIETYLSDLRTLNDKIDDNEQKARTSALKRAKLTKKQCV